MEDIADELLYFLLSIPSGSCYKYIYIYIYIYLYIYIYIYIYIYTSGPDEPVNSVMPCWTGVEECDVYEGDFARNRSDEPVNSVVRTSGADDPGGSCVKDSNIY